MPKRVLALVLAMLVCFLAISAAAEASTVRPPVVDARRADIGVVAINYAVKANVRTRLEIARGENKYHYDLKYSGETFPLQMGSGDYLVRVLEQIEGQKYRVVYRGAFTVHISDEKAVFLNSVQNVRWDNSTRVIGIAQELTSKLTTDMDKLRAVHDYIVNSVRYNATLLNNLKGDYTPNLNAISDSGEGICYDFASMMAAMLRSVGIPTRLVMGYSNLAEGYHAWNEVYIADKDSWVVVDASIDAQLKDMKRSYSTIKQSKDYSPTNWY